MKMFQDIVNDLNKVQRKISLLAGFDTFFERQSDGITFIKTSNKMKFKIHWSKDGIDDSLFIYGESIEECQEKTKSEMEKRGLNERLNNCWSEEIFD